MAAKKKPAPPKVERDEADHVMVTATHEVRVDDFGNLVSCVNLETGESEPLPSDVRYLAG